jgi:hypothetical protein
MGDLLEFPKRDSVNKDLFHTVQQVVHCLNDFRQLHPTRQHLELFGAVMLLIVKNEHKFEGGVTAETLLAHCRNVFPEVT